MGKRMTTVKTRAARASAPHRARMRIQEERRAKNRESMINTILECARDILREGGPNALNMQVLAKAVGVQAPSLYEYFDSKHAILDALFERGRLLFEQRAFKAMAHTGDLEDTVHRLFNVVMKFATEHPDLYQLVFNNAVPHFTPSAENRALASKGLRRGIEGIKQCLRREHKHLPISVEDAALLAEITIWGVTNRIIAADAPGFTKAHYKRLVDAVVTLLKR